MGTAVAVFEKNLTALSPHFAEALGQTMPVARLIRTVMISVERLPKLLDCDQQSLFNAAMSAAVLGLEVDGVTGQAFLIPFKSKAQLVIGYKGYTTLAARSNITLTGSIVREGDVFEYEKGSSAFVRHVPQLGNKGRIVAAWACASANNRPPVVEVLSIDELMAVKAKSPGAKMYDSPWNDPTIGFPAMCEKTAKRRLARSLPLNIMQLAARLDETVDEQGKPAWINQDKNVVIEGEIIEPAKTPTAAELIGLPGRAEPSPGSTDASPAQTPVDAGAAEVESDELAEWDDKLATAAKIGSTVLKATWGNVPAHVKPALKAALDRRHKPAAAEADQRKIPA